MTPDPREDALAKALAERDSYRAVVKGSGECAEYWRVRARTAETALAAPTPYVRPAAEVQAEIERLQRALT